MIEKFNVHKSTPFSFKLSSNHPTVLGLCDALWDDFKMDKTKKVHLKKECLVNTIANLKVSWNTNNYIRYSRWKNNYAGLHYRYKPEYYTYDIMTGVMDNLESMGLIKSLPGFINLNDNSKLQTAVCLKKDFKQIKNNMISDIPPPETIILKSRDTKIKKYYKDTESTRKMRYELALYNGLRQSTKFSLRNLNSKIINFNPEYFNQFAQKNISSSTKEADLRNPYVYRVFNDTFSLGGRYYNGLESNASKEIRSCIHINGNPTVEKDYSCLHIRMLYNTEGIDLKEDAYSKLSKGDPGLRGLFKLIGLVSINSKNLKTCLLALRDEIRKSDYKSYFDSITDKNLMYYYDKWIQAHPRISKYLNSDIGISLQNKDSVISAEIIRYFTAKAIPVLIIHDSFIIEKEYESELEDVMKKVYKNIFKFDPIVC
ncbi:MAG: hypothetical protein IPN57_00165 [Ignavibacteria bacterium]|nr:hypothetical protein [Ignavibacteria bacterium]